MEELNIWAPGIGIIFTMVALLYNYFCIILKIKEDKTKSDIEFARELSEIKIHVAAMSTKLDIFWRCVEERAIDILKSFPSNVGKDVLLDKLKERSLNLDEAERLRTILIEEAKVKDTNKFVYIMFIGRLEQIILELRNDVNKEKGYELSNNWGK